jgi:recombination protein RecT
MARVAVTAVMRSPKLLQATPESLLSCLMQCSQFGLEPDGRRAHLIPFENRNKGTVECTLIIDWKGLAELALRGGTIAKLHADLLCDKDEFEYDLGDILHHKVNFRVPRGEPYAAYALAVTKTGEKFVAVMTKDEIEAIRDKSQGWKAFKAGYAKQSPWQDSPGEMWKKTAFRRLSKWLPLSPEIRDAVEVDDEPLNATVTSPENPVLPVFGALPEHAEEAPEAAPEAIPVETVAAPEPEAEAKQPHHPPFHDTTKPEESVPSTHAPKFIDGVIERLAAADLDGMRVLAFYNKNRAQEKPEAKTLDDIPEASWDRLLKPSMVTRIKATTAV